MPVEIKQDSEEWGYVLKHKDIIEETEYYSFGDQSTIDTSSQTKSSQDTKMNTLSLFALANRYMKTETKGQKPVAAEEEVQKESESDESIED